MVSGEFVFSSSISPFFCSLQSCSLLSSHLLLLLFSLAFRRGGGGFGVLLGQSKRAMGIARKKGRQKRGAKGRKVFIYQR